MIALSYFKICLFPEKAQQHNVILRLLVLMKKPNYYFFGFVVLQFLFFIFLSWAS